MKEEELVKHQLEQHQRNQEIDKATQNMSIQERAGFVVGVEWADQHPRKELWDKDKVCSFIEDNAGKYIEIVEGRLKFKKTLITDLRKAMED